MITPENLVRHELIGLRVKVADSSNKELVGLSGRVVDETRNTLTVETAKAVPGSSKQEMKEVKLAKDQCVFSFTLPSGGSGEEKAFRRVRVDGKVIVARPEDRIKKKLKKW